jgi:hypothetical protein
MHANDGFALMDIANPVNEALDKFILDNTDMYLIKKLTLEVSAEGYELQTKQLAFTTDFPASITVSGKVFTKELDPLPAATVNILETGDSFLTDSEGNFKHSIMLDGIDDIELGATFYLDYDQASKMTMFKGGFFESAMIYDTSGKTRKQIWNLETAGTKVFGTAYVNTSKGYQSYPIKGESTEDGITLTLDCKRAGTDFGCEQVFNATRKNGTLEGKWTGTGGGGSFNADTGGYRPVERKVILTDKTADIKTYAVDFNGKLLRSSDNILNIGAGRDSNAMIYISPNREALKLDPIKHISAKLVLTHLPDNQRGRISIFKYDVLQDGTQNYLGNSQYAGQIYPSEEPYSQEIDITDVLLKDGGSVTIGGVPEAGSYGNHNFSTEKSQYDSLKPYIIITEYSKNDQKVKTVRPFVFINKAEKAKDLIGDRNKPGADGTPDYCYEAVFSYPGKSLTGFELSITGDIKRHYNTSPLDIYPLVGFVKNGILQNNSKGEINLLFEKSSEKLNICINGNYIPKMTDRISYKYFIDGRPVEGLVQ